MKLSVCTYNLRNEKANDGINCFPFRKEKILAVINETKPDLIGFQETMEDARLFLAKELTDYTVLGCGRELAYSGEGITLAYRKDKFDLLNYDAFWLSATPDACGSYYGGDQSINPRMAQAVHLIPKGESRPFIFCNTHLDDLGPMARYSGSVQILQYFSKYSDLHMILTGDFNAIPSAAEVRILADWQKGKLKDVTEGTGGTFHGFGRVPEEKMYKIDYIFTDLAPLGTATVQKESPADGVYSSDHYPVFCDVELA